MGRRSAGAGARPDGGHGSRQIDSAGRAGRADDRHAGAARIAARPGVRQRPPRRSVSTAGTWRVLVGIDLATAPGKYPCGRRRRNRVRPRTARRMCSSSRRAHFRRGPSPWPRRSSIRRRRSPPAFSRKRRSSSSSGDRPRASKLWDGAFVRPVPDPANSAFGARSIFNGQPRSPHGGADFLSAAGTPVKAPNAGRVALARDLYFTGNTVVIDHGLGLFSLFAHLSEIDVQAGAAVGTGDVVGRVGATGRVSGPAPPLDRSRRRRARRSAVAARCLGKIRVAGRWSGRTKNERDRELIEPRTTRDSLTRAVHERPDPLVVELLDGDHDVGRQGRQRSGGGVLARLRLGLRARDRARDGVEHQDPPERELRQRRPGGTSGRSRSTAASPASYGTPDSVSPLLNDWPSRLKCPVIVRGETPCRRAAFR